MLQWGDLEMNQTLISGRAMPRVILWGIVCAILGTTRMPLEMLRDYLSPTRIPQASGGVVPELGRPVEESV